MGTVIYLTGVVVTLMILIKWIRDNGELEEKCIVDVFFISLIILIFSFFSWFATLAIVLTLVLKRK